MRGKIKTTDFFSWGAFMSKKNFFKRSARKSLLSSTVLGALAAGNASAQDSAPLSAVNDLEGVSSSSLTDTGDLRIVFDNGFEKVVNSADITVQGGDFFISGDLASAILAEASSGFALGSIALSLIHI